MPPMFRRLVFFRNWRWSLVVLMVLPWPLVVAAYVIHEYRAMQNVVANFKADPNVIAASGNITVTGWVVAVLAALIPPGLVLFLHWRASHWEWK